MRETQSARRRQRTVPAAFPINDRTFIRVFAVIASMIPGWWLGENLKELLPGLAEVTVLPLLFLAGFLVGGELKRRKALWILMLISAFVVAWLGGRKLAGSAFNDCVDRGEDVRRALIEYRGTHGEYPETLADLGMRKLPGRRLLRGNLLQYWREGIGYALVFEDFLVTHTASDSSKFRASQ